MTQLPATKKQIIAVKKAIIDLFGNTRILDRSIKGMNYFSPALSTIRRTPKDWMLRPSKRFISFKLWEFESGVYKTEEVSKDNPDNECSV